MGSGTPDRRRDLAALATVAAFLVEAGSAAAAPPTTDGAWEKLYEAATQLLDRGKAAEACPMLEDAVAYRAGAGVLLSLGECYAATGRYVLALARYEQALAAAPDAKKDPAGKERRAREGLAAMNAMVARVEISIPPDAPPGMKVRNEKQGRLVGNGDVLVVDPGEYQFSVSAPGYDTAHVRVKVDAGERVVPKLSPGAATQPSAPGATAPEPVVPTGPQPAATRPPAPAAGTPPPRAPVRDQDSERKPDAEPETRSRSLVLPGLALGAGVIGLATMAVSGGLLLHKKQVIADECDSSKRCSPAGLEAVDSSQTIGVVGTTGAAVGIAGVAGFITWLVWSAVSPPKVISGLTPAIVPGRAGVEMRTAF